MDQEPKQQQKRSPLVLGLIIIIVLLIAVAAVLAVSKFGGHEELEPAPVSSEGDGTPKIGYEEGVTVVDDPDALQKAVDEALAKAEAEKGIPLEFSNYAESTDGKTFECYFANPADAVYDVYVQLFADAELTDQIYLSGLIPPGKAKRDLKLDHALAPGNHTVYVAYTQVEDDHATVHGQVLVTAVFSVKK